MSVSATAILGLYPAFVSLSMESMKDQTADTGRDTKVPKKLREQRTSPDGKWRSFSKVPNLLQYVSTGTYFARVKVDGKLFRQSLDTDVYTTAITKLPDFLKRQREKKKIDGEPVTFADAQKLYEADLGSDHSITENTKRYRRYCLSKLNASWPGLAQMKLRRITATDCQRWAGKLAAEIDEQYFNNVLGTLRAILQRAGIRTDEGPTKNIERLTIEIPSIQLPSLAQLKQIIGEMETSGAGRQQECADFARFLAFSGCRLSEARRVTWADVDFDRGEITVQNAKVRRAGDRAQKTRTVPIIPPMRELLDRLQKQPHESTDRVCGVGECEKSLVRACKNVGVQKLTHHKLRDMFATIAIESGVDIPTVADWLGHSEKDGGKLLLTRYRKHRSEHSKSMAQKVTFGTGAV